MTENHDVKTCEQCGESFARKPKEGRSIFARRRYCGMTCRIASGTHTCKVETCSNPINSAGLCSGHYLRMRRTGVVGGYLQGQDPDGDARRFWSCVDTSGGADACWRWTKETNSTGYGVFRIWRSTAGRHGIKHLAHRFAYADATGEDIKGKVLLHRCDTPPCVNPAHLRPGTQAENIADARSKGRMANPPILRGSSNRQARLVEADVVAIRTRLAAGETQRSIADDFGVNQTVISAIKLGKSWRHVTPSQTGVAS